MLRQYHCSPHRLETVRGKSLPVGVIPVGTICRLYNTRRSCFAVAHFEYCDTIIVEAWLPRVCAAGRFDPRATRWENTYHATGMFLAVVRSLRDGKRRRIADHILRAADEIDPPLAAPGAVAASLAAAA